MTEEVTQLSKGNNVINNAQSKQPFLTSTSAKNTNNKQTANNNARDRDSEDQFDFDNNANLVDWSLALDFSTYTDSWNSLGTSMPSDIDNSVMYHLAGTQNKDLGKMYYGK
eukprot:gene28640-35532_t